MGKRKAPQPHEIIQAIDIAAAHYLLNELDEIKADNNRQLETFMSSTLDFFDALREVDRGIARIESLSIASGGDDTARAFGKFADSLWGALNALSREVESITQNPFADLNYEAIRELTAHCDALRKLANTYTKAKPAARPSLQRNIARTIAESNELIALLFNARSQKRKSEVFEQVTRMIQDRRGRGMDYDAALNDIKQTDPSTYGKFFNQPTQPQKIEYARKLVERFS